jgi:hypothetical protein
MSLAGILVALFLIFRRSSARNRGRETQAQQDFRECYLIPGGFGYFRVNFDAMVGDCASRDDEQRHFAVRRVPSGVERNRTNRAEFGCHSRTALRKALGTSTRSPNWPTAVICNRASIVVVRLIACTNTPGEFQIASRFLPTGNIRPGIPRATTPHGMTRDRSGYPRAPGEPSVLSNVF